MQRNPDTILALDPGLRELGYAVLQGPRLVTAGVLNLRLVAKATRLDEARKHLRRWLGTHQPDVVVVEKTYRHPVPWLNELHEISRSAHNFATRRGQVFATYSPQRVRQTVAGNGKAKKRDVAVAVTHTFPNLRVYLTQDRRWKERYWLNMTDAIALALHHQAVSHPPSRSRISG
jgi:Holliday junction resolvasome RuvABC endonuclease subunit